MTEFEHDLIKRLNAIRNTYNYNFDVGGICDAVVDTLIDCNIPFYKDGEVVTEYVFPKELRSGDTFYWVTNVGDIDEYVLSKVVYHKEENGDEYPYEVFIIDGKDEYSVGWVDIGAYGRYIFTDIEEARECARRCRM